MHKDYDFAGWVTKNDILCSDGVTIKQNAFLGNDNATVPLVWNHVHNDPNGVLGHIRLQNRAEGVYGYGYFNDTKDAQTAKRLVASGDIVSMSIAANKIQKNGTNVVHGNIYEVSLVLAGANKGAKIEYAVQHSDEDGEVMYIQTYEIIHSAVYPEELADNLSDVDYGNIRNYIMDVTGKDVEEMDADELLDSLTEEEFNLVGEYINAYTNAINEDGEQSMLLNHSDEIDEVYDTEIDDEEEYYEEDDEGYYDDEDDEDVSLEDVFDSLDDDDIDMVVDAIDELTDGAYDNLEDAIDALTDEEAEALVEVICEHIEHKANVELMHSADEDIEYAIDALDDDDVDSVYDFISELSGVETNEDNVDQVLDALDDEANDNILDFISYCAETKEVEHSMYNVFDQQDEIMHAAAYGEELKAAIMDEARATGSLKTSMIAHGVDNIESLITPEPLTGEPGLIRPEEPSIVDKILASVKRIPKRTVKGRWANLTEKEAMARGFIKGNQKIEEVFDVWNRETNPQTIYKLQAISEDDLEDIYDFNFAAFMKSEMKEMWRYTVCRSFFFSDGLPTTDQSKIKENCIRPITTDDAAFNTTVYGVTPGDFLETLRMAKASSYRGTGTPTLYADEGFIVQVSHLKDATGRYVFGTPMSNAQLAALLGVKEIVTPEFFLGTNMAVLVNMQDYEVATKNEAKMRDAFDIQYNLNRYLYEGRLAAALNHPKASITFTTAEAPAEDDSARV